MTIKELYEYAKENGMEDKHLVGVCLENGCVLVADEYPFGDAPCTNTDCDRHEEIEEGEIVDD